MKVETWVKTVLLVAVLVGIFYLFGTVLGQVEERIGLADLLALDLGGWGQLIVTLLVVTVMAVSVAGVSAVLVRSVWLCAGAGVLVALAVVSGWQGKVTVAFVTSPLGGGVLLVVVASLWIYMKGVAADIDNRIKFSKGSLGVGLTLLLLCLVALVSLAFYRGAAERIKSVTFESLLDNLKVEEFLEEGIAKWVPEEAREEIPAEELEKFKRELREQLGQLGPQIDPYLKYIPYALALSVLQFLSFLTLPISWLCPWVAGGILSLLKLVGVVRVRRGPVIIERLSLEEADFSDELSENE